MRTRVVTAAMLIAVALTTGCVRTTPGTVAQTTEPRPPGPDPQTVTCSEYLELDEDVKISVIEEIVSGGDTPFGQRSGVVAKTLADTLCELLPQAPLSRLLMGGPPR